MKIVNVQSDSLAETIGLHPGDRLLKINGKRGIDEIDYKFRITDELLVSIYKDYSPGHILLKYDNKILIKTLDGIVKISNYC